MMVSDASLYVLLQGNELLNPVRCLVFVDARDPPPFMLVSGEYEDAESLIIGEL